MTAEVKIKAGELSNVLIVPVQAVAEHKGEFFAFVDRPPVIERRKVKVGDTNEKMVQVLDGLKEGERVTLDARSQGGRRVQARRIVGVDGRRRRPAPRTWPRSRQAEPSPEPWFPSPRGRGGRWPDEVPAPP